MTLAVLVDALTERLQGALGDDVLVGDAGPSAAGDLPAVTLALDDVAARAAGIGRAPGGTRTGALAVTASVDLADPVLHAGAGPVRLLSADRRTLVLPHGPLVRADGTPDEPYGGVDLEVADTAPYSVVAGPPEGRQVRPDPRAGKLLFGQPLPESGVLRIRSHVGAWDVTVTRHQARLDVVVADAGPVAELVRRVAAALAGPDTRMRLAPQAWGASRRAAAGEAPVAEALVQRLRYRVDAELEEPRLASGGGVITRVEVRSTAGATGAETFAVVHQPDTDEEPA